MFRITFVFLNLDVMLNNGLFLFVLLLCVYVVHGQSSPILLEGVPVVAKKVTQKIKEL